MLTNKVWVVKVDILDAKDAKISDVSQIKCMHDKSDLNNNNNCIKDKKTASKKVKSDQLEPFIGQNTRKNATSDAKKTDIDSKSSAKRKEPRARSTPINAENVCVRRNLRSSKKNTATGSSNPQAKESDPSMPEFFDNWPVKKENAISQLSSALAQSTLDKSPRENRNHSSKKEKMSNSDPLSSDNALAKRSSKTKQECGPSMPDLSNDLNANGTSARKISRKFEYENIPEKIKKRRSTVGCFSMNRPSRMQSLQQDENIFKSKDVTQGMKTSGKADILSFGQKDPHKDLIDSLEKARKHFFENLTLNGNT